MNRPLNQTRFLTLVKRPSGYPESDDFNVVTASLPEPSEGEVVVMNRYLSVDPYMRGRMNDTASYFPPWPLFEPLDGDAVGLVISSRSSELEEGQWVNSMFGLRDSFVASAEELRPLDRPPAGLDYSCYIDLLGGTGFTAYLGVMDILKPAPGTCMFISTAAGSVGSIAGQICRAEGAKVIGSTGSEEKIRVAKARYGYDSAFNYREEPPGKALDRLAPEGLDGFFDNVGGDQLEAAIDHLNIGGRIAKCGAIEGYNTTELPPGPRNLHLFFGRRLTMTGFLVSDHGDRRPEFEQQMRIWIEAGDVRTDHRVFHGLNEIPDAFRDLFAGGNVGKTVIDLGPVPGTSGP